VEDSASVDRNKCLGCGLCASDCPTDAIKLVLRPDREEPFDGIAEMGIEILKGKQANAEKATQSA
jgi:ferredoxin